MLQSSWIYEDTRNLCKAFHGYVYQKLGKKKSGCSVIRFLIDICKLIAVNWPNYCKIVVCVWADISAGLKLAGSQKAEVRRRGNIWFGQSAEVLGTLTLSAKYGAIYKHWRVLWHCSLVDTTLSLMVLFSATVKILEASPQLCPLTVYVNSLMLTVLKTEVRCKQGESSI